MIWWFVLWISIPVATGPIPALIEAMKRDGADLNQPPPPFRRRLT